MPIEYIFDLVHDAKKYNSSIFKSKRLNSSPTKPNRTGRANKQTRRFNLLLAQNFEFKFKNNILRLWMMSFFPSAQNICI